MQESLAKTGCVKLEISFSLWDAELNDVFSKSSLVQNVSNLMQMEFTDRLQQAVNQIEGNRGGGLNKLRGFKKDRSTVSYCFSLNIDQHLLTSEWVLLP